VNKVPLRLGGIDGNAFYILAEFKSHAEKSGWTDKEISEVLKEAKSSDKEGLIKRATVNNEGVRDE